MKASVKNTFIVIDGDRADSEYCVVGPESRHRSRSVDANLGSSREMCSAKIGDWFLDNINALLMTMPDNATRRTHVADTPAQKQDFLEDDALTPASDECCAVWSEECSTTKHQHQGLRSFFTHNKVPKNVDLAEHSADLETPPTTMMIRNIPNRYSQQELMNELDRLGFLGSYDFFYMPHDRATKYNVGYAFVNFVDNYHAKQLQEVFEGFCFAKHQHQHFKKTARVSVAHLQGFAANLRHYENSAVSRSTRQKQTGPQILTPTVKPSSASKKIY
eukprot:TRINITY_DN2324_c0_g1_i12.p1 TRINITY_DN2324_c0_g1~~TRINITY_DN2324_c0_g1_i12.p1  ORF type:complete len:275 (+),score=52.94 TRINITY_DN2324_c0_g1_i12:118-942(+)